MPSEESDAQDSGQRAQPTPAQQKSPLDRLLDQPVGPILPSNGRKYRYAAQFQNESQILIKPKGHDLMRSQKAKR